MSAATPSMHVARAARSRRRRGALALVVAAAFLLAACESEPFDDPDVESYRDEGRAYGYHVERSGTTVLEIGDLRENDEYVSWIEIPGEGSEEGGTVTLYGDTDLVVYTAPSSYVGPDSFRYNGCHAREWPEMGTDCVGAFVAMWVVGVDAEDDVYEVERGKALDIAFGRLTRNDVATNEEWYVAPDVVGVTQGDRGTVVYNEAKKMVQYWARGGVGDDTFTYQACITKPKKLCDRATVRIRVVDPPRAERDDDDGDDDDGDDGGGVIDTDTDDDGVDDADDNCPAAANPDQLDTYGDADGDVCDDTDNDTVTDALDNCPEDANPGQEDDAGDGDGDACDDDSDDGGGGPLLTVELQIAPVSGIWLPMAPSQGFTYGADLVDFSIENLDSIDHNFSIDVNGNSIVDAGDIDVDLPVGETDFTATLPAGDYTFFCDVHPATMNTITIS